MFRDRDAAMAQQLDSLQRDAVTLREENEAMRVRLLEMQQRGISPSLNLYQSRLPISPGEAAALRSHSIRPFPTWLALVLHYCTFGLFSLFHFGLQHGRLPQVASDDPDAAKSIGLTFVPYYNLYWIFFNTLRLTDRINLQFRVRDEPEPVSRSLVTACAVLTVIPWINLVIAVPLLWPIAIYQMRTALNRLAMSEPEPIRAVITQEGESLAELTASGSPDPKTLSDSIDSR